MVETKSRLIGRYSDAVTGLQKYMHQARAAAGLSENDVLEVAVFGHGGRDTWGGLAVAEAMAGDEALCATTCVHVCTCSWSNDTWEKGMQDYIQHLEKLENPTVIKKNSLQLHFLKFHQEHHLFLDRMQSELKGKHLIVQCEQGVDFFVEPVTSEWLQDNYEDHAVHEACMQFVESSGALMLLLQTNSDLDLPRGIDGDELAEHIFGPGGMQTGAFEQRIVFEATEPASATAALTENTNLQAKDTESTQLTLIKLATDIGRAEDTKLAFKQYLGLDLSTEATQKVVRSLSLYAGFLAYTSEHKPHTELPVAGILELVASLAAGKGGSRLPWRLESGKPPPTPLWLLARLLVPAEMHGAHLRVLSQFRAASLQSAQTTGEYLCKWMTARAHHRKRRNVVDKESRCARDFWRQLDLAKEVAENVKAKHEEFDLWSSQNGKSVVLERTLRGMEESMRKSEVIGEIRDKNQSNARECQSGFELSPLWLILTASHIMVLDFACRLLESPDGVQKEYDYIASGLPDRNEVKLSAPDKKAQAIRDILAECFSKAWTSNASGS
eukprot:gnl/TRDRNA2_/TRDRNA2_151322_c0_seq1.p1 gnl/TRDRNA2_/TRDRNA2_151322_c0~~gnl/TRDRNA2_/TRDRNA2_151322_c0_seq1.p1  ORF type:complete len:592 (+),score=111.62 gnl/TRDRNA2_/TRDRNA2_151322_c0_seq1:114-1778(+)